MLYLIATLKEIKEPEDVAGKIDMRILKINFPDHHVENFIVTVFVN